MSVRRMARHCIFYTQSTTKPFPQATHIRFVDQEPNCIVEVEDGLKVFLRYFHGPQQEIIFAGLVHAAPTFFPDNFGHFGVMIVSYTTSTGTTVVNIQGRNKEYEQRAEKLLSLPVAETDIKKTNMIILVSAYCVIVACLCSWVSNQYVIPRWKEMVCFFIFHWMLESMGCCLVNDPIPAHMSDIMVNMLILLILSAVIRWPLAYLGISHAFQLTLLALVSPVMDLL